MSWEKALDVYTKEVAKKSSIGGKSDDESIGFYISTQTKNSHRIAMLATLPDLTTPATGSQTTATATLSAMERHHTLAVYRPNIGLQNKLEARESILKKYKRAATAEEARGHWCEQYEHSVRECTHLYRQGHCSNAQNCEIGLRTRTFHILAGSVLTVWSRVESLVAQLLSPHHHHSSSGSNSSQYRLQIIRVKTNDGQKIVGCVIPNRCMRQIDELLCAMSSETRVQQHLAVANPVVSSSDSVGISDDVKKEELDEKKSQDGVVEEEVDDGLCLSNFTSGDFFDFDFKN
jgi:hypothetical protein